MVNTCWDELGYNTVPLVEISMIKSDTNYIYKTYDFLQARNMLENSRKSTYCGIYIYICTCWNKLGCNGLT